MRECVIEAAGQRPCRSLDVKTQARVADEESRLIGRALIRYIMNYIDINLYSSAEIMSGE